MPKPENPLEVLRALKRRHDELQRKIDAAQVASTEDERVLPSETEEERVDRIWNDDSCWRCA